MIFAGLIFFGFSVGQGLSDMTEKQLIQLYLSIVEEAVTVFEPLWVDDSNRIPNSGFFDFRKYDDWTPSYKGYAGIVTIPGNGLVDFCYAILLTETDKPFFTAKKIPRKVILDHALKSIRWCCLTSVYVKNRYPYIFEDTAPQFLEGQYWRREFGYRADEVGFLTLAAAKLWKSLDDEIRELVEEVMIGGAPKERLARTWEPVQGGNQDQVKQDLSSTVGAAFLFPRRPDQKLYQEIIAGNGLDMVSTLHDYAKTDKVAGKPLNEWAKGWNLYQDYTSDHHGWAQIWYGCDKLFEGFFYVDFLSRLTGIPMPETLTYAGNGFDGVLDRVKILCLPQGEPASVHGMEYDSYYGSGLLAYLYGAVIKKDPVAAALEQKAALLLQRNSRAIPIYDYHRNNWAKAALAYLSHKHGGGGAEPVKFVEAWSRLMGTFHHRWWQNLLHRAANKLASFSWGTISSKGDHFGGAGNGVCGFVVPARFVQEEPEPLIYLDPFSITGEVEVLDGRGQNIKGPRPADLYRFSRDDTGFHTAGKVTIGPVEQRCAFFSFDDGPCIFMNMFKAVEPCHLTWSGVPVYFYSRAGMTTSRRYFDAVGDRPLEQGFESRSNWWSVSDRLGMAMSGGTGQIEVRRTVGRNWARTDAYKDKCDTVFASALRAQDLKPGETRGEIAAVFFPDAPHAAVEEASRRLQEIILDLPRGWKGLLIPGERQKPLSRHLAIANLDGNVTETSLRLTFDEGAPILSVSSVIRGRRGTMLLKLEPFESFGETLDSYAEVLGDKLVEVRKMALGRYLFRTIPGETVEVRMRFSGGDAGPFQCQDVDGKILEANALGRQDQGGGVIFKIEGEVTVLNMKEIEQDRIGPAVEIADATVREDGRVTLCLDAHDQSGIRTIKVFVDGRPAGEISEAPWVWNGLPGSGYHTFQVEATDDSPRRNQRKSDARTINIASPQTPLTK
jgi:hypothetical protein